MSIPVLGGPEIKLGIRRCHVLMAATSPERVSSPQGRQGCSHSSAGTCCLGTTLCTQLPVLEEDLLGEWEQELFRSSLPVPGTTFLPSLPVCPVAPPGLYTRTGCSPATQSPDCPMGVMEGSCLSLQCSVATKVFLSTFPQCFFCCWSQAVIAVPKTW